MPATPLTQQEEADLIRANGAGLGGTAFEHPVRLQNAVFTQTLDLSQCRFARGLDFSQCRFSQGLILTDAVVDGPLVLNDTVMGQDAGADPNAPLPQTVADLTRVRVTGPLSLAGAQLFGSLIASAAQISAEISLDRLQVQGTLWLDRAHLGEIRAGEWGGANDAVCYIAGDLNLTSVTVMEDLSLRAMHIGGQLLMETADIGGNFLGDALFLRDVPGARRFMLAGDAYALNVRVGGNWNFTGASFGGHMLLQNLSLGGTFFVSATDGLTPNLPFRVAGKVWLLGANIGGDLSVSGAALGGDLVMQNARVGQNLLAGMMGGFSTTIAGDVHLNSTHIQGELIFRGAQIGGRLNLIAATLDAGLTVAPGLDDTRGWQRVRPRIGSRIDAEMAVIGKRVLLLGLDVGPAPGAEADPDAEPCDVSFVGAQVSGKFSLFSLNYVKEYLLYRQAELSPKPITDAQKGDIRANYPRETSRLGAGLKLAGAQISGDIVLNGVTVQGDLDLRNVDAHANFRCRPVDLGPDKVAARASAARVIGSALNAGGDVDLTGLDLNGMSLTDLNNLSLAELNALDQAPPPRLNLRDARIQGALKLYDPTPPETGGVPDFAWIGGLLQLEALEAAHVILSGHSFAPERPAGEEPVLSSPFPNREGSALAPGLGSSGSGSSASASARIQFDRAKIARLEIVDPLPVADLSDLVVGSWEEPKNPKDPDFFLKMLQKSEPFRRSNYLAVETDLRNKGRDEDADRVLIAMRERDRSTTHSFWKRLPDHFFDVTVRYGTTTVRLVIPMLATFLLSVWLFHNPRNVEYKISPSAPAAHATLKEKQRAVHPVVHPDPDDWGWPDALFLATRMHVPILSLGLGENVAPSGNNMEIYAAGVQALSWVLWPLFLASASGFLRKRT